MYHIFISKLARRFQIDLNTLKRGYGRKLIARIVDLLVILPATNVKVANMSPLNILHKYVLN